MVFRNTNMNICHTQCRLHPPTGGGEGGGEPGPVLWELHPLPVVLLGPELYLSSPPLPGRLYLHTCTPPSPPLISPPQHTTNLPSPPLPGVPHHCTPGRRGGQGGHTLGIPVEEVQHQVHAAHVLETEPALQPQSVVERTSVPSHAPGHEPIPLAGVGCMCQSVRWDREAGGSATWPTLTLRRWTRSGGRQGDQGTGMI